MDIGKNIRQIRELKNFTQSYVADRLNMSIGGYSKIETGQTDVSLSKIEQIAAILETELGTLLNFDAKNIFNQYNNTNSVVTGYVETQNNPNILQSLNDIQEHIRQVKEALVQQGKKSS